MLIPVKKKEESAGSLLKDSHALKILWSRMADWVQYDSVWLVFLYVSWLCLAIFTGVDNSYLHQIPLPCSREAWIVPKADKKEM